MLNAVGSVATLRFMPSLDQIGHKLEKFTLINFSWMSFFVKLAGFRLGLKFVVYKFRNYILK